jgi:hypothetical protein
MKAAPSRSSGRIAELASAPATAPTASDIPPHAHLFADVDADRIPTRWAHLTVAPQGFAPQPTAAPPGTKAALFLANVDAERDGNLRLAGTRAAR